MTKQNQALVTQDEAGTLAGLFKKRVEKTPDRVAYRHCDPTTEQWCDTTWSQMERETARWQSALLSEGLKPGDRVGVMMPNCREWVMLDQATLGLGLVNVPLFYNDRGGNVAYIAEDAGIKLLVVAGSEQWESLEPVRDQLVTVKRIITLQSLEGMTHDRRLRMADEWLPKAAEGYIVNPELEANGLASIVYTSGTTGHPKGVMLSHNNILSNTYEALQTTTTYESDVLLSFLPLSHMLERTGGYYLPMMAGVTVAYARSIPQLGEDLVTIKPTYMISVPRIYERVYAKIQEGLAEKPPIAQALFNLAVKVGWRRFEYQQKRASWSPALLLWPLLNKLVAGKITAKLGGRLRSAVSGGAPLAAEVGRMFLSLGVPILQGYGLTETSPVLAVNTIEDNIAESVGKALPSTQVKVDSNGELLAKGAAVMLGFWNRPEETDLVMDSDGWFHTGDIARIDDEGHVYITGRIKDIIVLATGEKVSPVDMEIAITMDALLEQALVLGEGRPYLCALLIPEPEHWKNLTEGLGVPPNATETYSDEKVLQHILKRINAQLKDFPSYAQVRKIKILAEPWTVENGYLTPTLKVKRSKVLAECPEIVDDLYSGH